MTKFKLLFQLFVLAGVLFPCTLHAANHKAKKAPTLQDFLKKKCTIEDQKNIKKFTHKTKNKIKALEELDLEISQTHNQDDIAKLAKELNTFYNFFQSDQFIAMEIVYKRCGMEIPRRQIEPPFWMPEN